MPEQQRQLPEAWPENGARRQAANGDEYEQRARLAALDPLEQRLTLQTRLTLWRGGQRVAEEERTLVESLYFRNEVLLMLAQAGFADVMVSGGYTEKAPTAEDTMVVFTAQR